MDTQDYWTRWRENAERRGVTAGDVAEIARRHDITHNSFRVLQTMPEIKDPKGKSFFLIPAHADGGHAREAALMTYIFNAGTDYGAPSPHRTDFQTTPLHA